MGVTWAGVCGACMAQGEKNLYYAIREQKPLTDYARIILSSTQTVTVTQIAQDYGMSPVRMNQLLFKLHIQHKVGGQWILYVPL